MNIVGAIVVTSAAYDTFLARLRAFWIGFRAVVILPEPVLAPLAHITRHVVQPEFVGKHLCHLMFLETRVGSVPRHFVGDIASGETVTLTLIATARCVLPLGFRRQAERHAGEAVQSLQE